MNEYITLLPIDECPKCYSRDLQILSEEERHIESLNEELTSIVREIFCTSCKFRIKQVLGL